jgi:hypothetical protein
MRGFSHRTLTKNMVNRNRPHGWFWAPGKQCWGALRGCSKPASAVSAGFLLHTRIKWDAMMLPNAVARTESRNWARATFSKVKNHCQNRPKFAPNFGDIPYVVYCDLRTAAAFNRSVMKLLNSSGRGRLTLCDLSERGPSSGCCRKQAFRGVSGGRSGDALNLCGTSPKLQKGLNTL